MTVKRSGVKTSQALPGNTSVTPGSYTNTNLTVAADGTITTASNGSGGSGGNTTSTGTEAAIPAAGTAGNLYLPNDGYWLQRDSGAAWVPWGPLFPLTDPSLAGISTWVNQGGASVDTTSGATTLTAPAAAGDNIRLRVKTAPATPYVITARLTASGAPGASSWGLAFRQSSDGKLHLLLCGGSVSGGTPGIFSIKFTNPTTFSASYASTLGFNLNTGFPPAFLRIADNGTNRTVSYSMDGVNFTEYHTIGRTDFLTADQVGFFANAASSTLAATATLLSWKET